MLFRLLSLALVGLCLGAGCASRARTASDVRANGTETAVEHAKPARGADSALAVTIQPSTDPGHDMLGGVYGVHTAATKDPYEVRVYDMYGGDRAMNGDLLWMSVAAPSGERALFDLGLDIGGLHAVEALGGGKYALKGVRQTMNAGDEIINEPFQATAEVVVKDARIQAVMVTQKDGTRTRIEPSTEAGADLIARVQKVTVRDTKYVIATVYELDTGDPDRLHVLLNLAVPPRRVEDLRSRARRRDVALDFARRERRQTHVGARRPPQHAPNTADQEDDHLRARGEQNARPPRDALTEADGKGKKSDVEDSNGGRENGATSLTSAAPWSSRRRHLLAVGRQFLLARWFARRRGHAASAAADPSFVSATASTTEMTPALRAAYISAVQQKSAARHRLEPTDGGFRARSAARGLRAFFGERGAAVGPDREDGSWRWHPTATRWGCDGNLTAVAPLAPEASENRATYRRGDFDEWYVVGPLGIEHGFTIASAPKCRDGVTIELAEHAELVPAVGADKRGASLRDGSGTEVLRYSDLYVVDATGKELHAEIRARNGTLAIWFDDREATYPITVDPLITTEQTTLTATNPAADDQFGITVALSGDTAVVGAVRGGSAWVFVRDGMSWTLQKELTPSNAADASTFGSSVAVSGNTAVVGAPWQSGSQQGGAYVFVRNGTVWSESTKLTVNALESSALLGHSVAVSGDTVVIGAPGESSYEGAAYVFVRNGTTWSGPTKLTATEPASQDLFGASVAVSGDTVTVGAPAYFSSRAGAAYVFVRNGTAWSEPTKLTASVPANEDQFGRSVAVSGDTVVVGAPAPSSNGVDAAYVFVRNGTAWSGPTKLTSSHPDDTRFGWSVAVSGDAVVVSAFEPSSSQGTAYTFVRKGASWSEQQKLTASNAASSVWFGASVALDGNVALIGDPNKYSPEGAPAVGAAYVFMVNRNDGMPCSSADQCGSGFCVDGVCCNTACNGGPCDACSVAAGAEVDGICSLFTGNACDDGNACTEGDVCQAGVCAGTPVTCRAPAPCLRDGICNPLTGRCIYQLAPDDTLCDDNDACTEDDRCRSGVCTGTPVVCTALDQCHDVGTCDPATGLCSNPAKADGTTCDDGNACTQTDRCQGGTCVGGNPVACTALNDCHDATCNPATGLCSNSAKVDGTACTGGSCQAGTCTPLPDPDPGSPDAGADSGAPEPDAGTSEPDAGTSEPDAGTSEPDAGTSEPDAGTSEPDAGTFEPDAGTSEPDTGTSEPDSGTSDPGVGTPNGDPSPVGDASIGDDDEERFVTVEGGCGCHAVGTSPRHTSTGLLALGIVALAAARRRRSRSVV